MPTIATGKVEGLYAARAARRAHPSSVSPVNDTTGHGISPLSFGRSYTMSSTGFECKTAIAVRQWFRIEHLHYREGLAQMDVPDGSSANQALDPFTSHFKFGQLRFDENMSLSEQIYSLRFKVYCLECGFLEPENYADGLESDEFDEHSVHFTACNLANELVGSMRLVLARAGRRFPFEDRCQVLFDDVVLPPATESGEVSRLVVSAKYRRRAGDSLAGVSEEFLTGTSHGMRGKRTGGERRSRSPQILLGLYREMYRYSVRANIRYWYAAMEKSLARALTRLDFDFTPIGMETDYYGPVIPYVADLRELERKLKANRPDLLAWFRKDAERAQCD